MHVGRPAFAALQAGGENMSIAASSLLHQTPEAALASPELAAILKGKDSTMQKMNMCQAINLTLDQALENDDKAGASSGANAPTLTPS